MHYVFEFSSYASCNGIDILITDPNRFDPLATATSILILANQLYPKEFKWDELNRIDLAMRCLLLDNGKEKILIETGIGNKNSSKFIEMFCINIYS